MLPEDTAAATRRLGAVALGAGLLLAAIVQIRSPGGRPPLYDGILVEDAYRYLTPRAGQAGNPTSGSLDVTLSRGTSPALAAATSEDPPQAQLIARQGAFTPPPGAAMLRVTIMPVPLSGTPPAGVILGNVYRFAVTDEHGALAAVALPVTIVLRAPPGDGRVVLSHLTSSGWQLVGAASGGSLPDMFLTNTLGLGEFVAVGPSPSTLAPAVDVLFFLIPAVGGVILGVVVAALVGRRRPPWEGS